jgi:hypothetical protein
MSDRGTGGLAAQHIAILNIPGIETAVCEHLDYRRSTIPTAYVNLVGA